MVHRLEKKKEKKDDWEGREEGPYYIALKKIIAGQRKTKANPRGLGSDNKGKIVWQLTYSNKLILLEV